MPNPPAGWYDDPAGNPATERFWDGTQWTQQIRPVPAPAPVPPPPSMPAPVGEDAMTSAMPMAARHDDAVPPPPGHEYPSLDGPGPGLPIDPGQTAIFPAGGVFPGRGRPDDLSDDDPGTGIDEERPSAAEMTGPATTGEMERPAPESFGAAPPALSDRIEVPPPPPGFGGPGPGPGPGEVPPPPPPPPPGFGGPGPGEVPPPPSAPDPSPPSLGSGMFGDANEVEMPMAPTSLPGGPAEMAPTVGDGVLPPPPGPGPIDEPPLPGPGPIDMPAPPPTPAFGPSGSPAVPDAAPVDHAGPPSLIADDPVAPPPGAGGPAPTTSASWAGAGVAGIRTALLDDARYAERGSGERVMNQNSRLLKVVLGHDVLARQGSMVAFQGAIDFDYEGAGAAKFLKKATTGEGLSLMRCSGRGDLFLADTARQVHIIWLEGAGLTVNGRNILAFEPSLSWDIERVKGAGITAGGLFNTRIEGHGWVAITTDGDPVVLQTDQATFGDTDAIVAWSSNLQTSLHRTVKAKALVGRGSGEAVQLAFEGRGIVIVQPSEGTHIPRG